MLIQVFLGGNRWGFCDAFPISILFRPSKGSDWFWMGALCVVGAFGHFLLIKALSTVKADTIQPFAYSQSPFESSIGIYFFKDEFNLIISIGCSLNVEGRLVSLRMPTKASKN